MTIVINLFAELCPPGYPRSAVKALAVCVLVVTLTLFGRAVRLAFPTLDAAPQIDGTDAFLGSLRSDDLYAWYLERNYSLTIPSSMLFRSPSAPGPVSGSSNDRRSVANRNSNPLNIKFGSETRWYVEIGLATISEIVPRDGGRFLRFDSPETGLSAAVALLSTPGYKDLEVDQALRKWSNNGYGAEILVGTPFDAQKLVSHLGADDLKFLLAAMAAAEGYQSSTIKSEIEKALPRTSPG